MYVFSKHIFLKCPSLKKKKNKMIKKTLIMFSISVNKMNIHCVHLQITTVQTNHEIFRESFS